MSFINFTEKTFNFAEIFRVIISGSSGVGKTHLVKQLIQAKLFKTDLVVLFHPDACESDPTDWHHSFDVIYKVGLPNVEYLKSLPEYTTIVIDDQFDKVTSSQTIDYLVRVLSSKRKLHVFLLTQYYFAKGPLGVSIRDSCNYHVLMYGNNNSINRVASFLNLKQEVKAAEEYNKGALYPYIFIARDNTARSCQLQVFIDIIDNLTVVIGQMKYYLLTEADFQKVLKIKSSNIAELTPSEPTTNTNDDDEKNAVKEQTHHPTTETQTKTSRPLYTSRREFEAQVRRVIQRYKIRSSL